MHGITERYLSGQKADAAGFVRKLLDDLESRISAQFSRVSAPRGYSTTIENIVVFFPPPVYDLFLCLFSLLMKLAIKLSVMKEMYD
jgi:hypothetical protein